jgi:hypothetical protein
MRVMDQNTPHAPTLNGVPHLGRAEAILYVLLVYLFNYVHPRYARYIDAVAAHERLAHICETADDLQARFGFQPETKPARPLWRETDLPDIYFTLLFAWRLIRPRIWSGLRSPALSHQIFPTLEPD